MIQLLRYFLVFILLLLLISPGKAQDQGIENLPRFDMRTIHFGFTLGFNNMDFTLKRTPSESASDSVLSIIPESQYGFQIAIVSDLRINNNLNLRFVPGLSFGDRIVHYSVYHAYLDSTYSIPKKAESTFLDFPLLFKYKTNRINNFRAYVLFGGKYSIDLASQSKKKQEDDAYLKLLPHDYSVDIGTGIEMYLEYFKFGVELRMSYGIPDVLKRENTIYTNNIESLRSKMFWLCFTFE
ncbi:MAG: hypothetical protein CVU11_05530 [Bacteroidetes bacterium HGW-Bacteroidetes-6]|jgi:hypothetical protein|nr:MAG: hypothetical protein CVU11_05530 [Bacteroidetes bacterium HGW-Bacteroidetes-6]